MGEGKTLTAGHFPKLHGLIKATMSPSTPFLQFLGRVLRVMNQQVRATRQLHQPRIDLLAMLDIRANDQHFQFGSIRKLLNCLVPAECQERDFLPGIISRGKEHKALDVVPVKVCERDTDLLLLVADSAKVSAQISQSRAGVNDGDLVRIGDLPPNC